MKKYQYAAIAALAAVANAQNVDPDTTVEEPWFDLSTFMPEQPTELYVSSLYISMPTNTDEPWFQMSTFMPEQPTELSVSSLQLSMPTGTDYDTPPLPTETDHAMTEYSTIETVAATVSAPPPGDTAWHTPIEPVPLPSPIGNGTLTTSAVAPSGTGAGPVGTEAAPFDGGAGKVGLAGSALALAVGVAGLFLL